MRTSYPEIRNRLSSFSEKIKTGIYFHYPFCRAKCPYCHFYSIIKDQDLHSRWLKNIKKEIRSASEALSDSILVDTVYFGGGSPSELQPEEIRDLLENLTNSFATELAEITLEANPDAGEEWLKSWREAGVNRLSVGAQSFDDRILKILGRRHSAEKTREFILKAREAGFENINLDLIIGVPGATPATIEANLQALTELNPHHVSVYMLEELEHVPFKKVWEENPVPDEEVVSQYQEYRQELERLGYQQYEISNFSQPGYRCLHNLKYWQYQPFLGFGPSAASHLDSVRWQNVAEFEKWDEALSLEQMDVSEFIILGEKESIAEQLVFGLRLNEGINWEKLKRNYPLYDFSNYEKRILKLVSSGNLEFFDSNLRIPQDKLLLANSILAELLF